MELGMFESWRTLLKDIYLQSSVLFLGHLAVSELIEVRRVVR